MFYLSPILTLLFNFSLEYKLSILSWYSQTYNPLAIICSCSEYILRPAIDLALCWMLGIQQQRKQIKALPCWSYILSIFWSLLCLVSGFASLSECGYNTQISHLFSNNCHCRMNYLYIFSNLPVVFTLFQNLQTKIKQNN